MGGRLPDAGWQPGGRAQDRKSGGDCGEGLSHPHGAITPSPALPLTSAPKAMSLKKKQERRLFREGRWLGSPESHELEQVTVPCSAWA